MNDTNVTSVEGQDGVTRWGAVDAPFAKPKPKPPVAEVTSPAAELLAQDDIELEEDGGEAEVPAPRDRPSPRPRLD
jgi:hypothetical protein